MKKKIVFGCAVSTALILSGCGTNMEKFKDAPVGSRTNTPAVVVEMPDGFSNVAATCEGPNRVYTIFRPVDGLDKKAYGSVAVVPNDPRCTTSESTIPQK